MEWTDKENCIAAIALHKCGKERAHTFELLKLFNITHVFVYCSVFLDTGEVSNHKRSSWPSTVHKPQVINAELTEILSENKQKNHGLGNGYCAENHESHNQARLGTFKRQTGPCLTIALKENRKKIKMPVVIVRQRNTLYR